MLLNVKTYNFYLKSGFFYASILFTTGQRNLKVTILIKPRKLTKVIPVRSLETVTVVIELFNFVLGSILKK